VSKGENEKSYNYFVFEYVASSIQHLDVTQGRRSLGNVNVLLNAMGV